MTNIFPIDFEEKLTMAQDDYILFSDSEDGNKIKKAQYKNLKGEPGTPGQDGEDGAAATITVGSTTTGAAGSSASVTNSGTSSAAVLDFTIPQGAKGEPGEDGQDGADGAAATITVGTTTTLPAGSSATVTNVGTSQDAILNFGIPKGDQGAGSGDVNGPASSVDGHLAVFDGATGKIIKDGGVVPEGNVKSFTLSSTSDLTTAQAAYDWYVAGKNPIVISDNLAYNLLRAYNDSIAFYSKSQEIVYQNTRTMIGQSIIQFEITSGTVTEINMSYGNVIGSYLDTETNYSTPYTPTYAGSPATKKYVDDSISGAIYSGSSAPATPTEGMLWYDTTNDVLKTYDGSNWNAVGSGSGDVVGPASSTDGHLAVFDGATGKLIKDGGAIPTGVPSVGTEGQVLTVVSGVAAWSNPSGGDVVVSSQTGNILTSGMKIWAGEESDYANLGTYDNNTLYLTVPDSN